jgi:SAM-dependent methyltransferase
MARETSKAHNMRIARGDFERYIKGAVLDIGSGSDPIRPPTGSVTPWDWPQGDASYLATLQDAAFDCVYSSHCLEHMVDVPESLTNWVRVLKLGGYMYFTIPDFDLYEKGRWPSSFNTDHKHT